MKRFFTFLLLLFTGYSLLSQTIYNEDDFSVSKLDSSQMGYAVAVSGDYAAIGLPEADNGYVWIFKYDGVNWDIKAVISPDYNGSGLKFGSSVTMNDSTLFVGAPGFTADSTEQGAVFMFKRSGAEWSDQSGGTRIISPEPVNYAHFGYSLKMDGNWLIIGEPGGKNYNGDKIGAAYVLKYNVSSNSWDFIGWLTRQAGVTGDGFAKSVDISGTTAVVGAPEVYPNGYVYVYDGSANDYGTMTSPTATLDNRYLNNGDQLGYSVAISSGIIVAGALNADYLGSNYGGVFIFEKPATGWENASIPEYTLKITSWPDVSSLKFGNSVEIDNDVLIVGSPGYNQNNGAVVVYDLKKPHKDSITEVFILKSLEQTGIQGLGYAVAMNNRQIVAGAPLYSQNLGASYLFAGPYVVSSPDSISGVCGNDTVKFYARAILPGIRQWQTQSPDAGDFVNIADDANFSGTDQDTLTVRLNANLNAHYFRCIYSNYGKQDTSAEASVLFESQTPTVVIVNEKNGYYLNGSGQAIPELGEYATVSDNCGVADTVLLNLVYQPIGSLTCEDAYADSAVIHFRIYDISGNFTTITDNLIAYVYDTIRPSADIYDDFVMLDDNGQAELLTDNVVQNVSDNCQIADTIITKTHFTCDDLGEVPDTVKITDVEGNTLTVPFKVQVYDYISPQLTLSPDTFDIYLDTAGRAVLPLNEMIISVSDNCSVIDTIADSLVTCMQVGGVISRTISVMDADSNVTAGTVHFRVLDTIKPVFRAKDNGAFLPEDNNFLVLNPADFVEVATDNCPLTDTILSFDTVSCDFLPPDINKTDSTLLVSIVDINHDTLTDTVDVIVFDTVKPTVYFHADTIYLDSNGLAFTDMRDQIDSITDNCGALYGVYTLRLDSATCQNLGIFYGFYVGLDIHHNLKDVIVPLYVLDTIKPYIKAKDSVFELYLPDTARLQLEPAMFVDSVWDNCSYSIDIEPQVLTCGNTGSLTLTLTVTDAAGNTSVDTVSAVVYDTISVSLVCSDYIRQAGEGNNYTVDTSEFDPVIYGCATQIWNDYNNSSTLSGETFSPGEYHINWFAINSTGDTLQCLSIIYISGSQTSVTSPNKQITVFPNPATAQIIIQLPEPATGKITLIDLAGKPILSKKITSDKMPMSLRGLPSGIYYLQIETAGMFLTEKIIKK